MTSPALPAILDFLKTATGQDHIHPTTELLDSGILDSLTLMDLLVFIENEFDVQLDFADIIPSIFRTPAEVANMITNRQSPQRGASAA